MKTILALVALTAGGTAWAVNPAPVTVANPSLNVNVTNTPLPVSVTNTTTNQSVTVTNPATNPVRTADAFVRTPVRINGDYVVPDGFRLVVETVSLSVECPVADTEATAALDLSHMIAPGSFLGFRLDLALQSQGFVANHSHFTATHSVRFSLDPGDHLKPSAFCAPDISDTTIFPLVLGYLVSVNSPSLAP